MLVGDAVSAVLVENAVLHLVIKLPMLMEPMPVARSYQAPALYATVNDDDPVVDNRP